MLGMCCCLELLYFTDETQDCGDNICFNYIFHSFQMKQQLPNMEFGRRLAAERDLEKSDQFNRCNISRFSLTIDRDYVDR